MHADLASSTEDFGDDFIKQLQASVKDVKGNREMEGRFMVLEEMLRQEHQDGYEEGRRDGKKEGMKEGQLQTLRGNILDLLSDFGDASSAIGSLLEEEKDIEVLKHYFQFAKKAVSLEDFEAKLKQ